jgi:hypothetical protein
MLHDAHSSQEIGRIGYRLLFTFYIDLLPKKVILTHLKGASGMQKLHAGGERMGRNALKNWNRRAS